MVKKRVIKKAQKKPEAKKPPVAKPKEETKHSVDKWPDLLSAADWN